MKKLYGIGFGLAIAMVAAVASADLTPPALKTGDEKREHKDHHGRDGGGHGGRDGGGPHLSPEARKELQEAREKLRASRDKRRDDEKAAQKAKYGEAVARPEVKEELRTHAQRLARLRRIERIAKASSKPEIAKRTADALAKEIKRHEKKMTELKSATKGDAAP
jgi:hypothetical protein